MSTLKMEMTSLSSSVNTFSTFCSVSTMGLINVIMLMSLEEVSMGKDFCLRTFSSLLSKKVNLRYKINDYLLAVLVDKYKNLPAF